MKRFFLIPKIIFSKTISKPWKICLNLLRLTDFGLNTIKECFRIEENEKGEKNI